MASSLSVLKTQDHWKLHNTTSSAMESESISTVHVNSGDILHFSGRTGSGPKLNALNRVRSSKKIKFYF
jgi:hypothetical protein